MKNLILFAILIPTIGFTQNKPLSIFDTLMEKTWKADGIWNNGKVFKQEKIFEYSLNSTIVKVNTIGFIDQKGKKQGKRNFGIRQYDKKSDSIKFWEYDVFGGLTTGIVYAKGKNLFYQYKYDDLIITNMWEYVNDTTYNFKVGIFKNETWEQIMLKTQFIANK